MAKSKTATVEAVEAAPARRPQLVEIAPGDLKPWPGLNPRTHFDEAQLEELAASLKKSGMLEPILVHRRDGDAWSEGLIIAGERRWRAAVRAELATVPCLVREYTEEEALDIAIVENAQRSDLSPIEEARGFRTWLSAGAGRKVQDLAERIGKSQPFVSNRIRLLDLPGEILDLIEEDRLPLGLARDVLLPFARIPEEKRVRLFGTFAKWIRALKTPPTPDQVRREISGRAARLSRQVEPHEGVYGVDKEEPRFDAKLHKSCSCGGPKFEYAYNESVRCFDDAWWDNAQAEAKRQAKEEEQRRAEKLKAAPAGPLVEMTSDQFRQKYSHGQYESVRIDKDTSSAYGRAVLLDPAELAGARMVWVKDGYDAGLKCLDIEAVKRAKSAATRARNAMLKERRAVRAERYRTLAAKVALEPWMLGEILSVRPQSDTLLDVAREMGVDVGKHGEVYDRLKKMAVEPMTLLFKVLALRSRAGELGWVDPLEKEVDAELLRTYTPGLKALEARVKNAAAAPAAEQEKKGRVGKAKKVPAAEVKTPRQQLELRFEHVREAIAAVKAAGGVEALADLPDAEGNPLSTLARRVMSLQDFIAEHGAVPIHEAEGDELLYSIDDLSILAEAEALLQPAEVCA